MSGEAKVSVLPFDLMASELVDMFGAEDAEEASESVSSAPVLVYPADLNSYLRLHVHTWLRAHFERLWSFSVGEDACRRLVVTKKEFVDAADDSEKGGSSEPAQVLQMSESTPELVNQTDAPTAEPEPEVESSRTPTASRKKRPDRPIYQPRMRQQQQQQQQARPQQLSQPSRLPQDGELGQDGELLELIRPTLRTSLPVVLKYSTVTMSDVTQRSVEIYNFSAELRTNDIRKELRPFINNVAEIKWVDDTHAIAIFMDVDVAAKAVLAKSEDPCVRLRPMDQATNQSRTILRQLIDSTLTSWLPPKPRPKTTTVVARRMLGSALGISLKRPQTP